MSTCQCKTDGDEAGLTCSNEMRIRDGDFFDIMISRTSSNNGV